MSIQVPDVDDGINYWNTRPASLDGVLGGFGTGSLPRIDALGSRLFLLHLLPELCTVPSALKPLSPKLPSNYRWRALDVGAGIGRVTADVLLQLFSDVCLVEPVDNFVQEALSRGRASAQPGTKQSWKGIANLTKSVMIIQGTLQSLDPSKPINPSHTRLLGRVGYCPPPHKPDENTGFDVIWCQWCLGHLSDPDLVAFFRRAHSALRNPTRSLIVVKENVCLDGEGRAPRASFDEEDSSLTRSDQAWKALFRQAGLKLVREQTQEGLPEGLYQVKMYALR